MTTLEISGDRRRAALSLQIFKSGRAPNAHRVIVTEWLLDRLNGKSAEICVSSSSFVNLLPTVCPTPPLPPIARLAIGSFQVDVVGANRVPSQRRRSSQAQIMVRNSVGEAAPER